MTSLGRRGPGSQNQQDKDSVGSSSQCSGQDSSASSQVDLGQARAGLGSAINTSGQGLGHTRSGSGGNTEKDSTLRKPIIRITEHSPEARGRYFLHVCDLNGKCVSQLNLIHVFSCLHYKAGLKIQK